MFTLMGGFNVVSADGKIYRLNPLQFLALIQEGLIPLPDTTVKDIEDKSKMDTLQKAYVGVQISWSVVDLIARLDQHLPISLLEHFTLSVVCCTFVTFVAWIKKPKDVSEAINIKSDLKMEEVRPILEEHQEYFTLSGHRIRFFEPIGKQRTSISPYLLDIAAAPVCLAFGISHILAWNYSFPSDIEKLLWRMASVGVFVVPLLLLLAAIAAIQLDKKSSTPSCGTIPLHDMVILFLFFLYVLFRLCTFVEVWAAWRSSPPALYHDVNWMKYFPHFGS